MCYMLLTVFIGEETETFLILSGFTQSRCVINSDSKAVFLALVESKFSDLIYLGPVVQN